MFRSSCRTFVSTASTMVAARSSYAAPEVALDGAADRDGIDDYDSFRHAHNGYSPELRRNTGSSTALAIGLLAAGKACAQTRYPSLTGETVVAEVPALALKTAPGLLGQIDHHAARFGSRSGMRF